MRTIALSLLAAIALSTLPATGFAQGLSIGPGGIRIDDGRGYRRGYYGDDYGRGRGRLCRELRYRCFNKEELGESGAGNCRRYRQICG